MSSWRNLILQGDCLVAIQRLSDDLHGAVKMIYVDPPFYSGTDYSLRTKSEGGRDSAPSLSETYTYADRWSGGMDQYLTFMRERLEPMRFLLTEDGSLWVHLDWHIVHYIKVMLDEIFGYSNFVNEIVWRRTNSPKIQSSGFGSQHDVILLYAKKSSEFVARTAYRAHDDVSLRPYAYEDERGRFRLIEIEAQGIQRGPGRKQFEWHSRVAPYLYRQETLDKWWAEGRIYQSKNGRYSKKQYLSDREGVPVSDLWLDIPPVQGSSAEYTGFLTQKPVSLVSRAIECSTDENDIVADFFAGSGTTAVAAAQLGRRWVICDSSEVAVHLTAERVGRVFSSGQAQDFSVLLL